MSSNSPASQAEAANALKALFTAFPAERGNGIGGAATYLIAVEGYSEAAIRKAVTRLIRGEFDWFGGRFLPTTAELSRACRYCEDLIAPVERPALPAPGDGVRTADEQARIDALVNGWRKAAGREVHRGETMLDRDEVPAAKLAALDKAVMTVAERIKAEGLPKLSEEAMRLFRQQSEMAVPDPAAQFDAWDQATPTPQSERSAA